MPAWRWQQGFWAIRLMALASKWWCMGPAPARGRGSRCRAD